jgi:hypothetical protein
VHDRLSEQIATLPTLNKAQLLALWAENFSKDPPPNLRKELMVPVLAYRMQEKEFGGLSHAARLRLREVAASLRTDKPSQEKPDLPLKLARDFYGCGVAKRTRSSQLGVDMDIVARPTPACLRSPERLQVLSGLDRSFLGSGSHDRSGSLRHLYSKIF